MDSGEAFELLLAHRLEAQIARTSRDVVQRRRDQDLAALGERRDPRRENHRLTEEVSRLPDHFADMQSYPHSQRQIRMALAVGGERPLHRDRAQQGSPGARESDHEAVAERTHFVAAVGCDLLTKEFIVDANDVVSAQVAQLFV